MTLDNLLSELSSSQATSNILSPLFPMFWAPQKKWSPLYSGEWKSVRIGYLQFWGTWNKKYLHLYSYVHTRLKISRMSFYRILVSLCLLKKCPQTCFIQATQNRFWSELEYGSKERKQKSVLPKLPTISCFVLIHYTTNCHNSRMNENDPKGELHQR